MEYVLDGYCGLFCGACPVMLETKAGKAENPCHGCKSEQVAGFCASCGIKACARSRGVEFCFECAELQSCKRLSDFMQQTDYPYHQAILKNLDVIRQQGIGKWLEMQDNRWRCGSCNNSHSWWDETCPQCGQAVDSYKADL